MVAATAASPTKKYFTVVSIQTQICKTVKINTKQQKKYARNQLTPTTTLIMTIKQKMEIIYGTLESLKMTQNGCGIVRDIWNKRIRQNK